MAKYVRTVPSTNLDKDEYLIQAPNFLEEIDKLRGRVPKNGHLTINFIRDLIALAAGKYSDMDFNPMHVNISKLKNVPFDNLNDLNSKVINFLHTECPALVNGYVDYHIKKRPFGTKLIYFLGDHLHTGSFSMNGIDEIKPKDIDIFMGNKKKKIVGKPAITD